MHARSLARAFKQPFSQTLSLAAQELAKLLHALKSGGHKALIFSQMTRMLDVLEVFLNLHGYYYLRLDGSTKPEQRQILMQRFNTNPKIFVFILSTRSGGVGMNLTGADTVIFYDSDWNPAMDAQVRPLPRFLECTAHDLILVPPRVSMLLLLRRMLAWQN